MKKSLIVFSLLLSGISFGQVEFNHSAGATYLVASYSYSVQEQGSSISESGVYGYPGITYNPRLDFKLDKELSLSITAYPTIAINGSFSSREGSDGSLGVELPLLAQLNFGHHSTTRSRSDFGGFVAGGFNFGAFSGIGGIKGPSAQAGAKFYVRDASFGIRLEYTKPIGMASGESANIFGIGLLYNFER